jgi:M6 family metalloprotease-like protein
VTRRRDRGRRAWLAVAATSTIATSCHDDRPVPVLPDVVQTIVAGRAAPATDLFEVWVCAVPTDVTDPLYAPIDDRLTLNADFVVRQIAGGVGAYWSAVSHDAYRPRFVAGGIVSIAATETSQQCIDAALHRARRDADAVLVVANAQHASDQAGGRSTPGGWLECTEACDAPSTRRYVYIGANDFTAALDRPMPLDLIEHEIGHSLGLPHSGDVVGATGNQGVGPYDVMADPASPRAIAPSRRDAPDLLAVDRLDLGWLPTDAVRVADGADQQITLSPSTGTNDTRLIVVPIDGHRVLTVELLPDQGYDDHLPRAGVVVHLIDDSPEQCGATTHCTDLQRVQQIVAADGSDHTLLEPGDRVTIDGHTITIDAVQPVFHSFGATVTVSS